MSKHPDIALIRQGYTAFNSGDMDALASLMTTDCAHHAPGSSQVSGHFKGLDNVLAHYRSLSELTGGSLRVELEDVFPDGRGHAISVHKIYAERGDRGIEMRGGLFFTLIGEKITDIDECVADIDEADAFWGTAG
ncbi:nuclear transport factor 2 family protein [Streptomyces sp. SP18CS02]|uniref:nuclear transport factor 2 family protein n=1 Tax=Streptomyces sp. SP18CS02 TaxID=3002531 RepID=UPI002E781FBD|nr:nuclear transport factor 2 family protein [Streptomyces sp. SP18CS02]MEE1754160.1 nuclear transport factor 2 family protein [Streptomyces sp. SP18CS02]